MTTYAVISKSGVVLNFVSGQFEGESYVDLTGVGLKPKVGWVYNGSTFIERDTSQKSFKITRLAFLDRFTEEEYADLDLMSLDDPNADISVRKSQAKLRLYLEKVRSASFIDLSRADTTQSVSSLVALGILTQGRAEEILTNPVLDEEKPL